MNLAEYQKLNIPQKPGVYFFKQKNKTLYIGKATNLAHRTGSYFQKKLMETRGPIIVKMVEESTAIEFRKTDSVLEALILESTLIKKHQPEYNTKEKDDKSYNYIVITDEILPRVLIVRGRNLARFQNSQNNKTLGIYGPFPSRKQLIIALGIIRKIFPFYDRKSTQKYAQQFYAQLGLLPETSKQEGNLSYQKNIKYISLFFEGKKNSIIRLLKKDLQLAIDTLQFERAARIRDQLYALEHIKDIALMRHDFEAHGIDIPRFRIEAYDIAHTEGQNMLGVMVVQQGNEINTDEHRVFNIRSVSRSNDTAALYETLTRRFQHDEWWYPNIIVVDGGVAQKRIAEKVLREKGISIPVVAVVKDEQHKAKALLGQKKILEKYKRDIISLNAESHRFALSQHTKRRGKTFLQ